MYRKKYYLKEDIFDNIDTEEKAYWLGFLYADGNVANNASRIRLSLAENDLEILEKFSIFISLPECFFYFYFRW